MESPALTTEKLERGGGRGRGERIKRQRHAEQ